MDPVVLMAMVFSLIVLMLLGGFILLFPLSRRLGLLLEEWIRDKRRDEALPGAELQEIIRALAELEERVDRIDERQRFLEKLVDAGSLPPGAAETGVRESD